MKVYLKCRCGARRTFDWDSKRLPDVDAAYAEGWRSYDGEVCCPLCSMTQRNDPDEGGTKVFWKVLWEQIRNAEGGMRNV